MRKSAIVVASAENLYFYSCPANFKHELDLHMNNSQTYLILLDVKDMSLLIQGLSLYYINLLLSLFV